MPTRLRRWERKTAAELGGLVLAGVGLAPDRVDVTSSRVVHVRRSLTDAEIAGLDPAWLAIEATDRAGGTGPGILSEWAGEA